MEFIKLKTIGSTNDFLKTYNRGHSIKNFTIVSTENQTNGKGQRNKKWTSEPNKNLTFSILIKDIAQFKLNIFILNVIISNCLYNFTQNLIPKSKVSIKWPNDIFIRNNKISGILIELIHKTDQSIDAIVGIGFNVNQTQFTQNPNATSLAIVTNTTTYKIDELTLDISSIIKNKVINFDPKQLETEVIMYNQNLYKRNIPSLFKTSNNKTFMGQIVEVTIDGKIHIIDEENTTRTYQNGTIQLIIPS